MNVLNRWVLIFHKREYFCQPTNSLQDVMLNSPAFEQDLPDAVWTFDKHIVYEESDIPGSKKVQSAGRLEFSV